MIILGTNSIKDTGFNVANSLRFNSGSSDWLNRTPSSTTNQRLFSISAWVKRSKLGIYSTIASVFENSSNQENFGFLNNDKFQWQLYRDEVVGQLTTNRLFRDVGSWYHILGVYDSANSTAGNRMRLYVNGVEETSFATDSNPGLNQVAQWNKNALHQIGGGGTGSGGDFFNGYMSEFVAVDGTALSPTDVGEFDEDSGIFKPIDVSGLTFGTNGFYLDFENSGALGADVSGNSNNFTVNNLTAIDQSTDTCTNNFATLNPLNVNPANTNTFSEGNLKAQLNGEGTTSTMAMASGNWYMEYKCSGNITQWTGVEEINSLISLQYTSANKSVALYVGGATMYVNGANQGSGGYGSSWSSGDIGMIAFDADNARVYFGKNGGWWNGSSYGASSPSTFVTATTGKTYYFRFVKGGNTTCDYEVNFGGTQSFAISSGNTDGNGYGNFEYAVPSSYYSLNTKNLAEYG